MTEDMVNRDFQKTYLSVYEARDSDKKEDSTTRCQQDEAQFIETQISGVLLMS